MAQTTVGNTTGQANDYPVDMNAGTVSDDTQRFVTASGATATLSNVNDSASSVTLAASTTSRLGLLVFNDSTEALYLKYGSAASTTSFTLKIAAGGYWEMPGIHPYSGIVTGIWAANASGAARITELT